MIVAIQFWSLGYSLMQHPIYGGLENRGEGMRDEGFVPAGLTGRANPHTT